MSTASPAWPRPGTHEFRQWLRRLLMTALLPLAAVALALGSILVATRPAEGVGDAPLGVLWLALIAVGIVGGLALFDRRTVVVGIFALAVVVLINPLSTAVLLVSLGLSG